MSETKAPVSEQDTINAAEGLIDTDKLKSPSKPVEEIQGQAAVQEPNTEGKPTQQPEPVKQTGTTKNEKPSDSIKVDTAFGVDSYGDSSGDDVKLSSWADVQAFAKDNELELNDVNDIQGIVAELKYLRTEASKLPELEKNYSNFQEQLKSMPNEVAAIYDAGIQGNHIDVIKQIAAASEIDFSKHFKEQDVIALVGRYTGKSFNKEGFNDMDDTTQQALSALAETKYQDEQKTYVDRVQNRKQNQDVFQKNFSDSVETSISKLKEKFPKFKDDALNHVKTVMTAGLKESLFNTDNTYRDDAAVRIAMQEYGESALQVTNQTIGDMAKQMKSKIESDTREQLLGRSDIPENRGKSGELTEDVILKTAKTATSFLH